MVYLGHNKHINLDNRDSHSSFVKYNFYVCHLSALRPQHGLQIYLTEDDHNHAELHYTNIKFGTRALFLADINVRA